MSVSVERDLRERFEATYNVTRSIHGLPPVTFARTWETAEFTNPEVACAFSVFKSGFVMGVKG